MSAIRAEFELLAGVISQILWTDFYFSFSLMLVSFVTLAQARIIFSEFPALISPTPVRLELPLALALHRVRGPA